MPVVVNEMEVTPAASETSSSAAASGGNGKPMDPREVERAVMKQVERRIRVRAH